MSKYGRHSRIVTFVFIRKNNRHLIQERIQKRGEVIRSEVKKNLKIKSQTSRPLVRHLLIGDEFWSFDQFVFVQPVELRIVDSGD